MTADGDRQPIRRRRRMAFPRALRYGENGRSGTPGGVGDGLSRRAPRAVTFAEEAHRSLCRRPGRRWTHGWRGAEDRPRLSTNIICRLFGTRRRPRRRSHPSRPPRRSRRRVVAAILGPMGPEFQRLPRREDGRRVPPDDDTVVVLRRRRRRGSRATTAITVATAIPKAPHRLVVRLRQEIRRPAGCDLARVGPVG